MRRGFTIIELVMVIAILGILLGIVTTAAANSIKQARSRKAEACCKAAANTADRDLSALFADLCRQKKQTRQALETLLERIMG